MITSSANQQMKRIIQLNNKAKTRYGQRVFVVEGMKMCMEAPREDIVGMYVSESFLEDGRKAQVVQGRHYEVVSDSVFRMVADTQTPQGILCLVKMPEYNMDDLLGSQKAAHILILENIQDPGNLGTMVRTGEAAGITGILMDKATVDFFHPKTIRATMGAVYRVPYYIAPNLPEAIEQLKAKGVGIYAAHLSGELSYSQPDYAGHTGFLVGNEGNGLSPEAAGLADTLVRIPMEGDVESLNAAVAAALLMYEAKRQRG